MSTQLLRSRQAAFLRQCAKCFYCGVTMSPSNAAGPRSLRCTAEHLIPRCQGGRDRPDNIVAACVHCNQTRHRRKRPPTPQSYREEVRRRISRGGWHPQWVFQRGLIPAPHGTG